MSVVPVHRLDDPRVSAYRDIKDRDLRERRGLFVVEGRLNLRCLIERSPHRPHSVLLASSALAALSDVLAKLDPVTPVYLAPREVLREVVGFDLHRGCLALCPRPDDRDPERLVGGLRAAPAPSLVVALEAIANHDNVGGLFRNAMAFGADAALLCPRTCDPLYRKAIRTSMGGSLCVPFARVEAWPEQAYAWLRASGHTLVALDPAGDRLVPSAQGGEAPPGCASLPARCALIVGTEGKGLSAAALDGADRRVRIDMACQVDSLNVATAAGIAMHHVFEAGRSATAGAPR